MSTISKERVKDILEFGAGRIISPITDDEIMELARIALASLEVEAVGEVSEQRDGLVMDGTVDLGGASTHRIIKGASKMKRLPLGTKFYTAPPAPVSVPDFPEILPCPVILEPGLRFGKGVPTKAVLGALQRRAEHHAELEAMTPEQRAKHDAGMKEFAAMLQGAEQPQNEQQNIPENIPATQFKSVADLYGLTSPTGGETSFTFDAVEARDFIDGGWSCQEYVQLERFQEAVSGNSPVIPDEALSAIRKVARIRADFDDFDGDRRGIGDCLDEAEQELIVTINKHASVIAAAPQQEVAQALAKGMERYGDAMQKLADSGD